MVKKLRIEICPICGKEGKVKEIWTVNKYGKKYNYKIFDHHTVKHYVGAKDSRKITKKGEIMAHILELINSANFRLSVFSLSDIQSGLKREGLVYNTISIRNNLNILNENGLLNIIKKGKRILFVNNINNSSFGFNYTKVKFILIDKEGDGIIRNHDFLVSVKNNSSNYLNFIPIGIIGDSPRNFEDINFIAKDVITGKEINPIILLNQPKSKRLLLKFVQPLAPQKSAEIEFFYDWEETYPSFTFGSATEIEEVIFEIRSIEKNELKVTQISSDRTTNIDISDRVMKANFENFYISKIKIDRLLPSSILFLEWNIAHKPQ
ncbi:MAG: hypothetical protein ACP5FQ_07715 [Thermoplasmata archaeon]